MDNDRFFMADLTGSKEVPPVRTNAEGTVLFHIENKQIRYRLDINGLTNITEANIEVGRRNINGPVVVYLFRNLDKPFSFHDGFEGYITENDLVGPLQGKSLHELRQLMIAGKAYVNVHTKENPRGEIRGKIKQ